MPITRKEKQLLDSQREIQWIKRQIEQIEQEERANREAHKYVIPQDATEEHVEESIQETKAKIDELKSEYDMLCQFNKSKEALAKAVNHQHFTLEALYPKLSDHESMEVKKATEEQINARDEHVVQFMKTLKQLNKKKKELTEIQQKIMRQHEKNKDISAKVETLRSNKRKQNVNPEATELLQAMNAKRDQISLIRGVLNGIILESGIAWDEDERWLNTMLRIGDTLPTF
ncbi:uncharacterized protein ATC70_012907 [Mucor velutinosus]|uniref:Centromere protein H C-terminal domain-containing protein n=1 Tax=Mucor velutinosus TaxID=708070 RepID=A0AAN7HY93_9FUNG|nr:hypothetical protein ATC70_012907 [Mucor velutinosus]